MKMRVFKLLSHAAIVIGISAHAAIAAERSPITIFIERDGTTFWNGTRLKNDGQLAAKARPYGQSGHRIFPKITVRRGTKYKVIAHVADILEHSGCCVLGVVNTNYAK